MSNQRGNERLLPHYRVGDRELVTVPSAAIQSEATGKPRGLPSALVRLGGGGGGFVSTVTVHEPKVTNLLNSTERWICFPTTSVDAIGSRNAELVQPHGA